MRVLLIGGTGFIGPSVAAELQRLGHEVIVFHRGQTEVPPGARELIGDRRQLPASANDLRALAPDVVVDLILSSGTQARELMTVFRGATSRVVALSSMDVYRACGVTHRLEPGPLEPLPLTEASAVRTKLQTYPPAQVQMLKQIFGWLDEEYDKIPVEREILGDPNLQGTVLRLPMVYGPGDPLHRFHPIVKRIEDGRQTILISADMAQWRATKGFVENVGAAIALAAVSERAAGRIYNVGEPDTLTELEWAQQIARAMSWNGEFTTLPDDRMPPHLRAPGNTAQHWIADTTRFREELGFREPISRQEAVRRTVEWERADPPSGFSPHQFDYSAEDRARQQITPPARQPGTPETT
jgi:nucleoside-diphosphate-sugar epimerase